MRPIGRTGVVTEINKSKTTNESTTTVTTTNSIMRTTALTKIITIKRKDGLNDKVAPTYQLVPPELPLRRTQKIPQ